MAAARRQSDAIFNLVRSGSLYERPIPERHRIIFYVGHLEAFDWNLLHENAFGLKSFEPQLDRLFAFGIDPVGGGLPTDQPGDWPYLEVVRDYVRRIRGALDAKLSERSGDFTRDATRDGFSLDTLLNVAIEHRLMHVETLAYMLHQLPVEQKIRQVDPPTLVTPPVSHEMMQVPAGVATLGLSRTSEGFGWDNEFEVHTVRVPAFEIDRYMVTNRQYLDFVEAGGYEIRAFWSDIGWEWKASSGISHPVFWKNNNSNWLYHGMFEEIPFEKNPAVLDWPVYVSQAEAAAYAKWVGKDLPTEGEWQRAAYGTTEESASPCPPPYSYPWGAEEPKPNFGNFDFERWHPMPVNAFPAGRSALGVEGMLGNGWEWTSTLFAPFPGFEPFPFYRGYSADFFDGKHFVMKGGSPRTAACMLRPTFRNWFQAHYQFVYAGFRCVKR